MLDLLRIVSSDDIGKDESNVQTLLKKHKDITDELRNYSATIDALHEQAQQLGESDKPGNFCTFFNIYVFQLCCFFC